LIVGLAVAGMLAAQSPGAAELYIRARRAERSGHMAEAYLLYSQAAANVAEHQKTYCSGAGGANSGGDGSQGAAPAEAASEGAAAGAEAAVELPPRKRRPFHCPKPRPADKVDARRLLPPMELQALPGQQNFDITGDTRQLYSKVAQRLGWTASWMRTWSPANPFTLSSPMSTIATRCTLWKRRPARSWCRCRRKSFGVKDTPQNRLEREPTAAVRCASQRPFRRRTSTA